MRIIETDNEGDRDSFLAGRIFLIENYNTVTQPKAVF